MDKNYWQGRYEQEQTGWDAGAATQPIIDYFKDVTNKKAKILIPGCGNAYEAAHLWKNGFTNVYICDWAEAPLNNFSAANPDFPKEQLLNCNFFTLKEKDFDYIIEQTFFCALSPQRRPDYAQKMHELLTPGGKLIGLLFSRNFEQEGPPFGGSKAEYLTYFEPIFSDVSIENCLNSIPPRLGSEFFIEVQK